MFILGDEVIKYLFGRYSKVNQRLVTIRRRTSIKAIELNQIFHGGFVEHYDFSQFVLSYVAVDLRVVNRILGVERVLQYNSDAILRDELIVFVCAVVRVLYLRLN